MLRLALSLLCLLVPSLALADDWSLTEEHASASTASVRIVEPEGYQVTLNGRTDTAPAVFAVPNADNYVTLAFTSPSGAAWQRKVEVKAYRQTVVRARHAARERTTQPRAATFIGILANWTQTCAKAHQLKYRFELVLGPDVIKDVALGPRERRDLELPAGDYRIRRYQERGGAWQLAAIENLSIQKDGWSHVLECK